MAQSTIKDWFNNNTPVTVDVIRKEFEEMYPANIASKGAGKFSIVDDTGYHLIELSFETTNKIVVTIFDREDTIREKVVNSHEEFQRIHWNILTNFLFHGAQKVPSLLKWETKD